ncbi:glycosyltransferase [Aliarcobacter butzleri]|uniref:glycosyltransferase n=1 Tax=Aliarcobacter butzleri TaxID=28197 RepID=UPI00344C253C
MKKILFVSYFLPPFNSPQSIQIGRLLKYFSLNSEYEIAVVTANQSNVSKDNELYPDIFENVKEVIYMDDKAKNKYFRYAVNILLPSLYQLPDEYKDWHQKSYVKIIEKFEKNSFDLILTFSFPLSSNILGKKLKEYFGCEWIAHQSDPWASNHFNNYSKSINQRNLQLEKDCFELADKIIFTSDETKDFYRNRYQELEQKFYVLEHTNDSSLYPEKIIIDRNKKVIRYIGGFYGSRTPEPIYKAIDKLKKENRNINFVFEIYGFGRSITKLLKKYDISEYVAFKGGVSYLKSLELMVEADLLVLIDAPSSQKSIFFPSKLVDYIGSKTPIVVISPDGTSKRVANENGLHYFDLDETEKIADFLENIDNLEAYYENRYDVKNNIKDFIRIIEL